MQTVDTLISARWVVPVEPHGVVLEHHAVAIRGGRIVDVLPAEDAELRFEPATSVTLDDHVLIPGLVNAHTHAPMTLMRGIADDLPLMTWLEEHIWPVESRWVSEEFVRDGVSLAAAEMLRGGTTCFNDMYFYSDVAAHTAISCGIRACVGLIVLDFPSRYANDADEYLAKGLSVYDEFKGEPLISVAMAPHAPYTVSDPALTRVRTLADELEIPIHMHVHETRHEVDQAVETSGKRPLERLQALGLVSPSLIGVHMTQLEDREIARLAESSAHVVHCPESNLKLASGFCPVQALTEAGVNVCLGTDGAASNNDLDMFGEMRTAALLAKGVADDATAAPAASVLRMATLNGAAALGLSAMTGSLRPGKDADITAVAFDTLETVPCYDVISQLVYATGRERVSDVWVAGRHVLNDRRLVHLDENDLREKAIHWADRIRET
ncbi:MAG: TRZ/ATZ family hydrolase [Pseudomonadota bacterium]|nr:TRZ/ATZ family hydrolase [Pseudomonadota bacterium]